MENEIENQMANISISDDEEEEFILKEDHKDPLEAFSDRRIVGKLLTNKAINFSAFRDRMAGLWRPEKGVHISEPWPQLYLFEFFHPLDVEFVMESGPWSFDNNLLLLHKLQTGEIPQQVTFTTVDFWLQIHDLPMGYMSESVGKQLGSFIGNFITFDPNNLSGIWRPYMRIKVAVPIDRPLKRWKRMRREGGEWFKVTFKYERLPIFCFLCGLLGHRDRFCSRRFATLEPITTLGWGQWLRASQRRNLPSFGSRYLVKADGSGGPEEDGGYGEKDGNSILSDRDGNELNDDMAMMVSPRFSQPIISPRLTQPPLLQIRKSTTRNLHYHAEPSGLACEVGQSSHRVGIEVGLDPHMGENDELTLAEDKKRKLGSTVANQGSSMAMDSHTQHIPHSNEISVNNSGDGNLISAGEDAGFTGRMP